MRSSKSLFKIFALSLWSLTLMSCAKGFQVQGLGNGQVLSSQTPDPGGSTPTPTLPPYQYKALLWEPVRSGSRSWSSFVFDLLKTKAHAVLNASDFDLFCPRYNQLSFEEKINTAAMLISAMTKFESGFNPASRLQESSLGTDAVTGQTVYSEGLLQLSYQDTLVYPFCQFDWETDQHLTPTDPTKTILDPYRNLSCGLQILANQVSRKGKLVLSSGAYWSVIKDGSPYEKIDQIATLVNSNLDFCH